MKRTKPKKGRNRVEPRQGFRSNTNPFIIVCDSRDERMDNMDVFCSASGRWKVIIYNPDSLKWWDRLGKNMRSRIGPPNDQLCHALVIYNDNHQDVMHRAAKSLGEWVDIASVALVNPPEGSKDMFEIAMRESIGSVMVTSGLFDQNSTSLRNLWSFQDTHNFSKRKRLQLDQTQSVCEWQSIVWRWHKVTVAELYNNLKTESLGDDEARSAAFARCLLRKDIEKKAAILLESPETRPTAEFVLCSSHDPFVFGRVHSVASETPYNGEYLVSPEGTFLDAFKFAATVDCSDHLSHVQALTTKPDERFSIPMVDPMITFSLLPALFPFVSGEQRSPCFDVTLGSRRIWPEHRALKASILYMFEGQPGHIRDLAIKVVRSALPKVWRTLLEEPPEEVLLKALLHPEVIEVGRLHRQFEDRKRLLPDEFEVKAKIYALARFVRTLRDSMREFLDDSTVVNALASATNLTPETVTLMSNICLKQGLFSEQDCENAFELNRKSVGQDHLVEPKLTARAQEGLGMFSLFLSRDRRNAIDSARICFEEQLEHGTNKTLIDCAMYCGEIRWISKCDDAEDGIWTCRACLHRWQKRGVREALQPRKLLHPMRMVPFSRQEYYDEKEWDDIMEVTGGDVSKLGLDYYWGRCSSQGCGRLCRGVARSGACAATDGIRLTDFPETLTLHDGTIIHIRRSLECLGPLGPNNIVTSGNLEKYFNTAEKLMYLPGPLRRNARNCIDKSTYILPRGILCDRCNVPEEAVEYCPQCGTGFEPIFACVHYSCPRCDAHFCKACLGIDGIHFNGVYNKRNHACWRILGNRYSYNNKGLCARCGKERPWPRSHALVSAGPEIRAQASGLGEEMPLETAIKLQSDNLAKFTSVYQDGVNIFEHCLHTKDSETDYCQCGAGVGADEYYGDDFD